MKKILIAVMLVGFATQVQAQKYITRTGKVTFFSATPIENIEAFNNEVASVINAENGEFVFQLAIKSFKFEKALMQEHFNENFMESDKYPKAVYKGTISDVQNINFKKDGKYEVHTVGKMTIHGVTKDVRLPATVEVKGDEVTAKTVFNVIPKDYNIKIPGTVANKIAKEIEVTVNSIHKKK